MADISPQSNPQLKINWNAIFRKLHSIRMDILSELLFVVFFTINNKHSISQNGKRIIFWNRQCHFTMLWDQFFFYLKYSQVPNSMFWVKENWLVLLMIFTNCYMSLKKWRENPIWKKCLCHRTHTQQKNPQKLSLACLCCN